MNGISSSFVVKEGNLSDAANFVFTNVWLILPPVSWQKYCAVVNKKKGFLRSFLEIFLD